MCIVKNNVHIFFTILATVLIWPVTGLLMESWCAAIPGLLAALMMVIRAIYEDRMLHAELPGAIQSMPSKYAIAHSRVSGNLSHRKEMYKWMFSGLFKRYE